jgi:hypothetical protein
MNRRSERRLELLALSHPLGRYARSLQPDVNAALLVVHRVMAKAMAEEPAHRPSAELESSLRADIAHISDRRARAGF